MIDVGAKESCPRPNGSPCTLRTQPIPPVPHLRTRTDVPNLFDGCPMSPTHAPPLRLLYVRQVRLPSPRCAAALRSIGGCGPRQQRVDGAGTESARAHG